MSFLTLLCLVRLKGTEVLVIVWSIFRATRQRPVAMTWGMSSSLFALLVCWRQQLTLKSDILWTGEIISPQRALLKSSMDSTRCFWGITQEVKTDQIISVRQHLDIVKHYIQRQLQNFYKKESEGWQSHWKMLPELALRLYFHST